MRFNVKKNPPVNFHRGPHSRNSDPDTSHLAGDNLRHLPGRNTLAFACLILHSRHPQGLTDDELSHLPGLRTYDGNHHKRRPDLKRVGLVEDSGLRRKTVTGNSAIVWRITPKGIKYLEELWMP
jgi:hypothetical protein